MLIVIDEKHLHKRIFILIVQINILLKEAQKMLITKCILLIAQAYYRIIFISLGRYFSSFSSMLDLTNIIKVRNLK